MDKIKKIIVIERMAGSGTRVNFDNFALEWTSEVAGAITQDSSSTVVQQVGQTPGAISYVALSYLETSTKSKSVSIDGVKPTNKNVKNNKYKVWGYEHMYTLKSKKTTSETKFINYVKMDKKDLTALGYISINDMKVDRDAAGKVSDR